MTEVSCALQDYKFARLGHEDRPKGEAKSEAGEGAYVAGTEYEQPVPTAHYNKNHISWVSLFVALVGL